MLLKHSAYSSRATVRRQERKTRDLKRSQTFSSCLKFYLAARLLFKRHFAYSGNSKFFRLCHSQKSLESKPINRRRLSAKLDDLSAVLSQRLLLSGALTRASYTEPLTWSLLYGGSRTVTVVPRWPYRVSYTEVPPASRARIYNFSEDEQDSQQSLRDLMKTRRV